MLLSFYPEVTDMSDPDPKNLIVNYIPTPVRDAELRKLFEPFGQIESVRVILDRVTSHPKGYGFVKYTTEEAAKRAIQMMNGYEIGNKRLRVTRANGPQHRGGAAQSNNDRQSAAAAAAAALSSSQQKHQRQPLFTQSPPQAPNGAYPNDLALSAQFPHPAFFPQHILSYQLAPSTTSATSVIPGDRAMDSTKASDVAASFSQAISLPPQKQFAPQAVSPSVARPGILLSQAYTVVGAAGGSPMYSTSSPSAGSNMPGMFFTNFSMANEELIGRSTAAATNATAYLTAQPIPCNLLPTQQQQQPPPPPPPPSSLVTTAPAASMPLLVKVEPGMPYEVMTNSSLPRVCYNNAYNLFISNSNDAAALPKSDNATASLSNPITPVTTTTAATGNSSTNKLVSRAVPSYTSLYGLSASLDNISFPSSSTNNLSNMQSSASVQTGRLGQSISYSSCQSLNSFQDGITKTRVSDGRY